MPPEHKPGPDPFLHHPELRDAILEPMESFFRDFTVKVVAEELEAQGLATGWWYSDETREALRAEALAARPLPNGREGQPEGDLWIFAYGSLMWDPAIRFTEVRRARVPGHRRRFILKDIYGGRGTPAAPGLMAALDEVQDSEIEAEAHDREGGCDGLLFRIARDEIETETEILWRREQIGPAYHAVFLEAETAGGRLPALTFLADHEAEIIAADLTREEQIHYLATGEGIRGTSLDYLRRIARKFALLDIHDEEVASLLREAEAYRAGLGVPA